MEKITLVNPKYFETLPVDPVKIVKKNKKFNLSWILFIVFLLFTIFFLYNCKYGFFKITDDNDVLPYSLSHL
jgi:hypothetical protein